MLNVLTFCFYESPTGAIGGGWYRTIELLKRGKKFGVNYIVIEPEKSFKKAYNLDYISYPVKINSLESSIMTHVKVFNAFLKLSKYLLKKYDIDLIYSPVEMLPSSLFPKVASLGSKVPWTIMTHLLPLYGTYRLAEKYIRKKTLHFKKLFDYLLYERKFNIPTSLYHAILWDLVYFFLKTSKAFLVVNKSVKEDLYKFDNTLGKKALTVFPGNGVDFQTLSQIKGNNKEYDAIVIASWHPKKGLWDALKLWRKVIKVRNDAKLAIAGRLGLINEQITTRIIKYLKDSIVKLGLEKNVFIVNDLSTGFQDRKELWRTMKKARILLYFSQIDAWPLTVGEALGLGIPVIAWDISPIRYSYGNLDSVLMVKPNQSANSIVKTIVSLLQEEYKLEKLSASACLEIKKYYTWDNVVASEVAAYKKIIEIYQ